MQTVLNVLLSIFAVTVAYLVTCTYVYFP